MLPVRSNKNFNHAVLAMVSHKPPMFVQLSDIPALIPAHDAVMTAAATGWSAPSLLAQNAQLQNVGPAVIQTDALQYYDQADQLATRRKRRFACTCPKCQNGQNVKSSKEGAPSKKQHVCHYSKCGKSYEKTSDLRAHLCWHTGERPFHCTWLYCLKQFTRSSELKRHLRTHTGEKRFVCTECSKRFMRRDHLSKHVEIHQKVTKERGDGFVEDCTAEGLAEEGDECSEDERCSSASEASPCEDHA